MKSILDDFLNGSIYLQFEEFLKLKYPEEIFSDKEKRDKFENIFLMGLRLAKDFLKQKKSCDLLWNGKTPRSDMVKNLGNILWELQKIPSFPILPPLRITAAIKKTLSSRDKRTQKIYLNWIIQYSNHKRDYNSIDLSYLVNAIDVDKIQPMESW